MCSPFLPRILSAYAEVISSEVVRSFHEDMMSRRDRSKRTRKRCANDFSRVKRSKASKRHFEECLKKVGNRGAPEGQDSSVPGMCDTIE